MDHDDGQMPDDYNDADVVIIGISRTSKTPTSIYLANRGIKTANIPIVYGVPLPEVCSSEQAAHCLPDRHRNRIAGSRESRPRRDPGSIAATTPTEPPYRKNWPSARSLCARHNWPLIDVTRRSINEETAAAIVALRPSCAKALPNQLAAAQKPRDDTETHTRFLQPLPSHADGKCRLVLRGSSGEGRRTSNQTPLERDGATPDAIALVLAKAKAKGKSDRSPGAIVIGSDQTMSLGQRTFISRRVWKTQPVISQRCPRRPTG